MKKHVFTLLILFIPLLIFPSGLTDVNESQSGLTTENIPGFNTKLQPYFGIGLFSKHDEEAGAKIKMPNSWDFLLGVRRVYPITPFNAFGFDIGYRYQKYCIKEETLTPDEQNPLSSFWDADKQSLRINSIGLEVFKRLGSLKPGGEGIFLDGGIRGDWNFANRLKVKNSFDTPEFPAGKLSQTYRRLDYINRTALTITGRIGYNKILIYGNYRLSDLISDGYSTPELPRLTVGLQKTF